MHLQHVVYPRWIQVCRLHADYPVRRVLRASRTSGDDSAATCCCHGGGGETTCHDLSFETKPQTSLCFASRAYTDFMAKAKTVCWRCKNFNGRYRWFSYPYSADCQEYLTCRLPVVLNVQSAARPSASTVSTCMCGCHVGTAGESISACGCLAIRNSDLLVEL